MDNDGWLTSKKSEAQIAQDRQAALATRRLQRGLQLHPQKAKRKRAKGFIVDHDDDDDEEEVEWNDDDEEEELTDPGKAAVDDSDGDTTSDSVSSPKSYFGTHRKRTSKPPPKVRAIHNRLRRLDAGTCATNTAKQKKKKEYSFSSSSEDDEDAAVERKQQQKGKLAAAAADRKPVLKGSGKRRKPIELFSPSFSKGDDEDSKVRRMETKPSSSKRQWPEKTIRTSSSSEDENARSSDKVKNRKQRKQRKTIVDDDSSDDEDVLLQSHYFASKPTASLSCSSRPTTTTTSGPVDDNTLLVDTPCKSSSKKAKKKKSTTQIPNDINATLACCSDDDEAMAIAAAMEESLGTVTPKKNDDGVVDLVDSDDDERDTEQDVYIDDGHAQAASAVLETANQLSAHIVQTMAQWSTDGSVHGMIVDGSLALMAATSNNESGTKDPNWISEETMRSILPDTIALAEYQLIGVNWLALLHGMKCEVDGAAKMTNVNGILADEMGLGKTCQTIAFLSWLKYKSSQQLPNGDGQHHHRPHLIVAPASVVSNWKREFETFAPQLTVVKYHGTQKERRELQHTIRHLADTTSLDIVLAPITYFQKETSHDRAFLRKIQFDYLIVDEGHLLKNARGIRYKSLDRFQTLHRLLLTGTPVQNSPKELMSLLSFLMPLFSSPDASSEDSNDGAESMLQHFVSLENNKDERAAYTKLKQLFSPFVLRRRKEDVLSQILPPKERQVELVEINRPARQIYDSVIARHLQAKQKGGSAAKEHLFTQLRKAAHHPLMLRTRHITKSEKEHLAEHFYKFGAFQGEACTQQKVAEEIENFSDFDIHLTASELVDVNKHRRAQLDRYILREDDLFASAKCVRLRTLLPEKIANKHRVLVFSQWTTCLDLLGCLLEAIQIKYLRMDGSTQVAERQSLIDEFNEDSSISVFLLSTKACGQGINLTSADTCIMHDLDFNPFNDLQAEDRCHRIGQKKPVTIIKMVSKDTVDEEIYQMQQRKAKMNAAIMGNDADWKKSLQREKEIVLRNVVDRFLQSPTSKLSPAELKENKSVDTNTGKKFDSI